MKIKELKIQTCKIRVFTSQKGKILGWTFPGEIPEIEGSFFGEDAEVFDTNSVNILPRLLYLVPGSEEHIAFCCPYLAKSFAGKKKVVEIKKIKSRILTFGL